MVNLRQKAQRNGTYSRNDRVTSVSSASTIATEIAMTNNTDFKDFASRSVSGAITPPPKSTSAISNQSQPNVEGDIQYSVE